MVRIISTRSEKLWGQNVGLSAASQLLRSGGGVTGAPDVHPLLPGSKINSGVRGEPFVAPAGSDCSDAPNLLAPPGTRGTSLSQATERLPWTSPSLSKPPAALDTSFCIPDPYLLLPSRGHHLSSSLFSLLNQFSLFIGSFPTNIIPTVLFLST